MKATKPLGLAILTVGGLLLVGCNQSDTFRPTRWTWFDPTQVTQPSEAINPIYEGIGVTDRSQEIYPNATEPTYDDLVPIKKDYVIGPGDVLRISILDLFQEGYETALERQVSNTGFIDLPQIPTVKASGLTQQGLIDAIKAAYQQAQILREPVVSALVTVPRQNIVSVLGAVQRPGTYPIPKSDFTLLEALAMVSDISQPGIEWVYVIRPRAAAEGAAATQAAASQGALTPEQQLQELEKLVPGGSSPAQPGAPATGKSLQEQMQELEKFIPGARRSGPSDPLGERVLLSDVGGSMASASSSAPSSEAAGEVAGAGRTDKWVFVDGQWIRLSQSATSQPTCSPADIARQRAADPFGWQKYDMSHMTRVIAINIAQLRYNPRMNIIVRDGDIIEVPFLEQGEFYVMGQVVRPGVYSLTGRRVTVKMALGAAGNLDPLAWPNNSVLIRRIDRAQEQYIPLPLQEIVAGNCPDYILKPNDVIAVGSYWATPFLAVWRNAFRMTYGFGFIYDRNFIERDLVR